MANGSYIRYRSNSNPGFGNTGATENQRVVWFVTDPDGPGTNDPVGKGVSVFLSQSGAIRDSGNTYPLSKSECCSYNTPDPSTVPAWFSW